MNRRKFITFSAMAALQNRSLSSFGNVLQSEVSTPELTLRNKLIRDPLRPRYHLLPQAGYVGDPCAPRFFRDQYHVYFHGNFGGKGWHHATSPDLIHWKHFPIAISPTPESFDSFGTFTGSVLPGGEGASVIYTGVTKVSVEQETIRNEGLREVQCIATSADADLLTWHKLDRPVIDGPPQGVKVTGFRDPFSWKDGDTWYVGVGSGFSQLGGAVLLYRSKDARHWEYLHPLAQGTWNGESSSNPVPSGEMWECPDFFPIGDKHVLIYSAEHTTFWQVGTFNNRSLRFEAECGGLLDHGAYYAPKSMLDAQQRRILWGWVQETRSREAIEAAGWAGCVSLPRVLTLSNDNRLQMEVAPEFASLRTNTVTIEQPRDATEVSNALERAIIRNRTGEITCAFKSGEASWGLELLLQTKTASVSTLKVTYEIKSGKPSITVGDKVLQLNPDSSGFSTIHTWIDGSVIEIFVDRSEALTMRLYDGPTEEGDIHVKWTGAVDMLKTLTISSVKPISDDRLTM